MSLRLEKSEYVKVQKNIRFCRGERPPENAEKRPFLKLFRVRPGADYRLARCRQR